MKAPSTSHHPPQPLDQAPARSIPPVSSNPQPLVMSHHLDPQSSVKILVGNAEGDVVGLSERLAVRARRALPVEHELVLRVADINPALVPVARVRAGRGAVRGRAAALLLLVGAEAVRQVVLVRVAAVVSLGAGSDLLGWRVSEVLRRAWRGGGGEGRFWTYDPVAADVALLDGPAVPGAVVLAKGAPAAGGQVGSRGDGGGEGEDGGGELHFELWVKD